MNHLLITLGGSAQLFRQKVSHRTLFEYARKENLLRLAEGGAWGHVLLDGGAERAYFSLLGLPGDDFPGESYLRAMEEKIVVSRSDTLFLAAFLTQYKGVVIAVDFPLAISETRSLFDALAGIHGGVTFHVRKNCAIAVHHGSLPSHPFPFPAIVLNREFLPFLPSGASYRDLRNLIAGSSAILDGHPANKVRTDLNENAANLLWVWGMGGVRDRINLAEHIRRPAVCRSLTGKMRGLMDFLEMTESPALPETAVEGAFTWIHWSLKRNMNPALWVKQFEQFDRDILAPIADDVAAGKSRALIVFDHFFTEHEAPKDPWALFLMTKPSGAARFPFILRSVRPASKLFSLFLKQS